MSSEKPVAPSPGAVFRSSFVRESRWLRAGQLPVLDYLEPDDRAGTRFASHRIAAPFAQAAARFNAAYHLNHRWAYLPDGLRAFIRPQFRIHSLLAEHLAEEKARADRLSELDVNDSRRRISAYPQERAALFAEFGLSGDWSGVAAWGPSRGNRFLLAWLQLRQPVWSRLQKLLPYDESEQLDLERVCAMHVHRLGVRAFPFVRWKTYRPARVYFSLMELSAEVDRVLLGLDGL